MKKYLLTLLFLITILTVTKSQNIPQVKIGNQVWMTVNLNVDTFLNGDKIQLITNANDWEVANKYQHPACRYYNFDPANGKNYGKLYNWWAVKDPRGLIPKGWHLPSDEEFNILDEFVTDHNEMHGGCKSMKLKSTTGWYKHNGCGDDNNSTGFSAFPGGPGGEPALDNDYVKDFIQEGMSTIWWSSSLKKGERSINDDMTSKEVRDPNFDNSDAAMKQMYKSTVLDIYNDPNTKSQIIMVIKSEVKGSEALKKDYADTYYRNMNDFVRFGSHIQSVWGMSLAYNQPEIIHPEISIATNHGCCIRCIKD